jgi:predicted AlkP superfamily pyrophosphatase or phosphodiesterase
MVKKCLILLTFIFVANFLFAQEAKKPKLIIGLVIDQMRWDYLYRYNDLYNQNGFKRLIQNGFSCDNIL